MADSSGRTQPPEYRGIGIALAISSGVLIGSSFVFKKKGLLSSQKGKVAGEGVAYLKSPMWWTGMIIMILGELCNFVAYAFAEAIIVTPMGALSVVICAILSHFILKEKLSVFGWIGSIQCILGAAILCINAPEEQSVSDIASFKNLFLATGFLSYGAVVIVTAIVLAAYVAPRWGKRTMLPYIGTCSLIGGLSVSCTQGLGACILTSIRGENQFKNWFIYFLLAFVVVTLLTEIYYLNVALALYNTAMVTPTYYVTFTFFTLLTSIILYQGLKASGALILTVILAFFVICTGITILQMSKVDPRKLTNIDDRTTLLLEAAKYQVDPRSRERLNSMSSRRPGQGTMGTRPRRRTMSDGSQAPNIPPPLPLAMPHEDDPESPRILSPFYAAEDDEIYSDDDESVIVGRVEEPGLDSVRGTFGAIGSLIRLRRRATALSEAESRRRNSTAAPDSEFSGRFSGGSPVRTSAAGEKDDGTHVRVIPRGDLRTQFFTGSHIRAPPKVSTTSSASKDPLIPGLPSVLKRPSTSPGRAPGAEDGPGDTASLAESGSPPMVELRRTSSLHAHFADPEPLLESPPLSRNKTAPPVVPSMKPPPEKDLEKGEEP